MMQPETYTYNGYSVKDHFVEVSLSHESGAAPSLDGRTIRLFIREAGKVKKAADKEGKEEDEPALLYLQGGPGGGVPINAIDSFGKEFIERGYRVFLLDQRGTGLSTPVTVDQLAKLPPKEQAEYLTNFRADSIVRDCEVIRERFLGKGKKWTLLGQSYGGFLSMTYLSFFPDSLEEIFLTGGMAPVCLDHPDRVYEDCSKKMILRNREYYAKYPADIDRVHKIIQHLANRKVHLPNSSHLTPRLFQTLGIAFGAHGGIDGVHQLILRATSDLETFGELTYGTLSDFASRYSYETMPIYAILHEAIYTQGKASNWSADRVVRQVSQFEINRQDGPFFFTGEMIFPFFFEDFAQLRPLKEAAHILAQKSDWPHLYNLDVLRQAPVKVSAITYFDDTYVSMDLAQETAANLKDCKQFITNGWKHTALRPFAKEIVEKLVSLSTRDDD